MLQKLGLTAALAASVLHSNVLAAALVPNLAPRADGLDSWVTVRPDGVVRTIQPEVTSIGGSTRTISPAPTAWTTYKDGQTVTISGQAPAPTADNASGAGSFVLCDKTIGEFAPFCTPEDGSVLIVGRTYYITWAPGYFSNFSDDIDIEGYYPDKRMAFEHSLEDVGVGFFAWSVPADLLEGESSGSKTIQLNIEYKGPDGVSGSQTRRNIPGPEIAIRRKDVDDDDDDDEHDGGGGSGNRSVAIAIPIVVAFVIIGLIVFCLWKRRKGGGGIRLSGIGFGRRNSGYGARQSRAQRTGENDGMPGLDNKGPAYQLQDSPTSPSAGRNVFREEIRRQENS